MKPFIMIDECEFEEYCYCRLEVVRPDSIIATKDIKKIERRKVNGVLRDQTTYFSVIIFENGDEIKTNIEPCVLYHMMDV